MLTDKNPGIRQSLEVSFNRNLVGKLERMNEANRARVADAEPTAKPAAATPDETDVTPPVT